MGGCNLPEWVLTTKPPRSGGGNLRELRGFEALEAGICDSCEDLRGPRWEGASYRNGLWALSLPPSRGWNLRALRGFKALDQGTTVGVKLVREEVHMGGWRVCVCVCSCAPACSSQNENPPSREWWEIQLVN